MQKNKLAVLTTLLFFPVAYLIFLKLFSFNFLIGDEWDMPGLFAKLFNGSLLPGDLFMFRNEHRPALPYLIMLVSGIFTNFNVVANMYIGFIFLCLLSSVFYLIFKRSKPVPIGNIWFLPVMAILFNLGQRDAILWGICSVQYYLFALLSVLSLFLIYKKRYLLSALAVVLCSFTATGGLLLWLVGALQIFFSGKEREPLFIWSAFGIVFSGIFLIGYSTPSYHPGLSYPLTHPAEALAFFFVLLGNIMLDLRFALPLGIAVLLAVFLLVVRNIGREDKKEEAVLLICVIAFTFLTAAALTSARGGLGAIDALSTRYIPLMSTGIAAFYLLFVMDAGRRKALLAAVAVAVICLYCRNMFLGISNAGHLYSVKSSVSQRLLQGRLSDAELDGLWPIHPEKIRPGIEVLKKYRLNIFSGGQ